MRARPALGRGPRLEEKGSRRQAVVRAAFRPFAGCLSRSRVTRRRGRRMFGFSRLSLIGPTCRPLSAVSVYGPYLTSRCRRTSSRAMFEAVVGDDSSRASRRLRAERFGRIASGCSAAARGGRGLSIRERADR